MMRAAQADAGKVVDFDQAMLEACPPAERAELLGEATLLAQAFAPEGCAEKLNAMAEALSAGSRDAEMNRQHARRLAAALRSLARRAIA